MHRTLFIREILLEIFGHCSPTPTDGTCNKEDLAALARTCRTFKEPALDVLWEELSGFSPLARCLPEACEQDGSFNRFPNQAEWDTLRGYTRRVRRIRQSSGPLDERIVKTLMSFTDPLFPNLRFLFWRNCELFPVIHLAVPSLTSLEFNFRSLLGLPAPTDFLDALGKRCPNIRQLSVHLTEPGPNLDAETSRQLLRWTSLELVDCYLVTLSIDTILHLPSMSILKQLSFTLDADLGSRYVAHPSPTFVFPDLAYLSICSTSLKSITNLFSCIQLPKIRNLDVYVLECTPKRSIQEYWTAVQKACPRNTLTRLSFSSADPGNENPIGLDEQRRPWLTFDDLIPYKEFGNLHVISFNVAWSVNLTDGDILDLVSTSPQLEALMINHSRGWKMGRNGGGITLSGLVQLLRQCPSLDCVALAIDARTFTHIPDGLDVSFPPRKEGRLTLLYVDSYVAPESLPDLKNVFKALKIFAFSPR